MTTSSSAHGCGIDGAAGDDGRLLKPGILYYRRNTLYHVMPSNTRCRGSVCADAVEAFVWDAVAQFLEKPELVASEVARQHATADEQRAAVRQELTIIEIALAKCDREAQRWADAYAQEVIDVAELKAYRAEIEARRRSLQAEHASGEAKLNTIGQAVQHVEVLTDECARVRQRLQAFDNAEKRAAYEALDIRVSWTPGKSPTITGNIRLPDTEIVQSTANLTWVAGVFSPISSRKMVPPRETSGQRSPTTAKSLGESIEWRSAACYVDCEGMSILARPLISG